MNVLMVQNDMLDSAKLEEGIEEHALLAHLLHEVDPEHDGQRRQQTSDLHLPAVEERDDQNGNVY